MQEIDGAHASHLDTVEHEILDSRIQFKKEIESSKLQAQKQAQQVKSTAIDMLTLVFESVLVGSGQGAGWGKSKVGTKVE
jgi:hypothetical protein